MNEKITIRPIKNEEELKMIMGWAAKEGWNPGKYDYKSYFDLDNKGYLLLLVGNKPVGSIAAVTYPDECGSVGLFIVCSEYRRKGLGIQIFEYAILNYLQNCKSISLSSVPQQIPRYSGYGFIEQYSNERFFKKSHQKSLNTPPFFRSYHQGQDVFEKACEYDKSVFKHDRRKLLHSMVSMPQTFGIVCFNKEGEVIGYGIARPCMEGYRIGPLYADNYKSARALGKILFNLIPEEQPVILDIPSANPHGKKFAAYFDLERVPEADTRDMILERIASERMLGDLSEDKRIVRGSLELGG